MSCKTFIQLTTDRKYKQQAARSGLIVEERRPFSHIKRSALRHKERKEQDGKFSHLTFPRFRNRNHKKEMQPTGKKTFPEILRKSLLDI